MQIFLIRHPRPLIEPGICYGQLDIDCQEVRTAADRLRMLLPEGIAVFSSPLQRARHLAEALSQEVCIDGRLNEINFGEWEGRRWDDIERDQLDAWADDILGFTPPGGESVAALQSRALDFAASLDLPQVAVVTHAGVMRALFGHWQHLPVAKWSRLQFEFGGLRRLEIEQGALRS